MQAKHYNIYTYLQQHIMQTLHNNTEDNTDNKNMRKHTQTGENNTNISCSTAQH